jgi:hypothetical protein
MNAHSNFYVLIAMIVGLVFLVIFTRPDADDVKVERLYAGSGYYYFNASYDREVTWCDEVLEYLKIKIRPNRSDFDEAIEIFKLKNPILH